MIFIAWRLLGCISFIDLESGKHPAIITNFTPTV